MASSTSKCRGCLNKANSFCYVCGDFTKVSQRRTINSLLRTAYFHYFDCKIGDQDKSWAPHICCKPCYNGLTAWFNGKKAAFNFVVTMVWREPRKHPDDCYFCFTNITGFNASSKKKIKYPNLRSAMRLVPHSDDLLYPHLQYIRIFFPHRMKKCLQERILPNQYLWKILSLHIQEQVAMNHTGWRKKTWMILLVICICQNSSQSSWLLGLNSAT